MKRLAIIAGSVVVALLSAMILLDRAFPPDITRLRQPSLLVSDKDGRLLQAFTARDGAWRLPVTVDAVDARYLKMLVAYEDKRFAEHPGVDPLALVRAIGQWVREGHVVSGASTLTMQTVRLLEPRPRTVGAKLIEMARALQLEWRYDKRAILGMYLTLAPYGGNLEGVRAAALFYFGKEPARLTDAEAALLVALPQAPESLRPDRYAVVARSARDRVLERLGELAILSTQAVREAREEAVPAERRPAVRSASHLAERLRDTTAPAVEVRTLVDGELQRQLEALALRHQARLEGGATVALLVVENSGRQVRAYVGSGDYFDAARLGQNDMVRAVRSPGSTLKPFIYGMAFEDLLIHPETIVTDQPMRFGDYAPENFDHFYRGEVSAREALQLSLNLPAVALLQRIGPTRFAQTLRAAGTPLHLPEGVAAPGLPIALGGVGITLEDLVTLYAGLADGGTVRPLRYLEDAPIAEPRPVVSPAAAWYVTRILADAPPPPNLVAPQNRKHARAIAFKTGTSYGFRDAWAIGYDADYTVGVWVGRPDGSFSPGRMGRDAAAPILYEAFDMLPRAGKASAPAAPPVGVIIASNRDLPPSLRRFDAGGATLASLLQPEKGPRIGFPADGATVDLGAAGGPRSLALQASGGAMPLLWLVNGMPVPSAPYRRQAQWQPDGVGATRITVIDRAGKSASVEAWIQ
jgi:penicillin-binding protein 1C